MKKVSCALILMLALILLLFPVTASASNAYYYLKKGDKSEAVLALQLGLVKMGYLAERHATGYYGDITEARVKALQFDRNFTQDGIARADVLEVVLGANYADFFTVEASRAQSDASASIEAAPVQSQEQTGEYSGNDISTGTIKEGDTSDLVGFIQECLMATGYLDIDKSTKYYGSLTEKAVSAFQKSYSLKATGKVDDNTLALLVNAAFLAGQEKLNNPQPYQAGEIVVANTYSTEIIPGYSSGGSVMDRIVAAAMEQLGKPYKHNTRGPDTFDCSGLVHYAYETQGIDVPSSSQAQSQYESAYKITSVYDLQVGDMLFFNTGNRSVAINHCGIYIGNGSFIHASSSAGAIIIRRVDSGYYLDAFRWALRVYGY